MTPDLDLTRDALTSSTLSHGLHLLGDRWTVAVILGAFLGVRRFDDWQTRLKIPRHTLTGRLKALTELGCCSSAPTSSARCATPTTSPTKAFRCTAMC